MAAPMDKPTYSNAGMTLAPVTPADLQSFVELLSEYSEMPGRGRSARSSLSTTPEDLSRAMFGDPPRLEAVLARIEGEPAGLACWSESYHVMSGRLTMDIKHFYVRAGHRRQPLAVSLLLYMLRLAHKRGYWRVEGEVGGWNKPAQRLYALLKAEKLDHIRYRLQDPGRFVRY